MVDRVASHAPRAFIATSLQLSVLAIALAAYYPAEAAVSHARAGALIISAFVDLTAFVLVLRGIRIGWWMAFIRNCTSVGLAIASHSLDASGTVAFVTGLAAVGALMWIWTPRIVRI